MGKSQRTKGAVGEREVAKIFSDALGTEFKRNIGQARDGGNDLDIGPLVVEVKRRKTLTTLMGWYAQAMAAFRRRLFDLDDPALPFFPVVVCREDNGPWLVVIRLDHFLVLTRDELKAHLEQDAA